jgi:hypothetical protein
MVIGAFSNICQLCGLHSSINCKKTFYMRKYVEGSIYNPLHYSLVLCTKNSCTERLHIMQNKCSIQFSSILFILFFLSIYWHKTSCIDAYTPKSNINISVKLLHAIMQCSINFRLSMLQMLSSKWTMSMWGHSPQDIYNAPFQGQCRPHQKARTANSGYPISTEHVATPSGWECI